MSGCRAPYLARLAWEELQFLGSAAPATELLASAGNPARRRALQVLIDVREFAEGEGLDVGGSYREVANTESAAPFHVVTAAYTDRLKPYTWWYPVVGSIPYRGYFDRPSAERFAERLRAKGLETLIVEASAYSTLGWFDDPLPSSVLDRGEESVVITVLHELVHQTYFAPGEVSFNETLATAAAWRLAERYWRSRGDDARADRMSVRRDAWLLRSDVLDVAADRLRTFLEHARESEMSSRQLLEGRNAIYAETIEEMQKVDPPYAAVLREDGLDNASFLASWRYAKGGRSIDAFLASHASVDAALERLADAREQRMDPHEAIREAAAPPVEIDEETRRS